MLRLTIFFCKNQIICPENNVKCQVFMLYLKPHIKKKMLYLRVISCTEYKKNFDLIIENLQPHKKVTFLKICKYNMSFIQQVIIIYSMSMKEQLLETESNVAKFCIFRTPPYILHIQCSNSIMYLCYIQSHSHHLFYLLLKNCIPVSF